MDKLLTMYSMIQVVETMYNNCYKRLFWPALVQLGIVAVCISAALCLSKWDLIVNDPRGILLFVAMIEGFIACIFTPYFASKVNTTSRLFLDGKCRDFSNIYLRKRTFSKRPLSIKISNNFMDSEFPLSVLMFCVNQIFSLIVIIRESN